MPINALERFSVVVLVAAIILLTPALQSAANSMIPLEPAEEVLITVGNWMGPMTAIHVQCSRNYGAYVLWWWKLRGWEEYSNFYLFYGDLSRMQLMVTVQSTAASPEHQYKCRLKVSKRHECEYLVLSNRKDNLKRCSTAVGGCKWVVKPEGMYFKSGNGTERGRFVQPHCSKPDLDYLRSWNHA